MKAIIIALFWVFALGTFAPLIKINGYVLSKDADSEEKFNDNEKVDENKDDSLPRSPPMKYSIYLRFINSGPSVVVKWTQNGNPKEAHIPSGYAYRQSIIFESATQPSAMQFRIYEAGTNKVVKIFHVTPTLQQGQERVKVIKIRPDPTAPCEDKWKKCLVWKQRIGCDKQCGKFMKAFCPKTCGLCRQEDEDIVTENDDSLTNSEENYIENANVDETKDDSHPTDSEENYIENAKVDETKDDSHPTNSEENYIENAKVDETKDDSHPTNSEENYIENAKVDETKDDSHPTKNMKNDPQWFVGLVKGIVHGATHIVHSVAKAAGHIIGGAAHLVGQVVGGAAHIVHHVVKGVTGGHHGHGYDGGYGGYGYDGYGK